MEKGICKKIKIVYGVVTVSDKGQVAIPVDLREDLSIRSGDKLLVLKRIDDAGLTFIKLDRIDSLMRKIVENQDFFRKAEGGDGNANV